MSDIVRVRKIATRVGRPKTLEDAHVVEGHELQPPTCGQPYAVRRTVTEHEDAPEVFFTSPVRAIITTADGAVSFMTDNSCYALEVAGR